MTDIKIQPSMTINYQKVKALITRDLVIFRTSIIKTCIFLVLACGFMMMILQDAHDSTVPDDVPEIVFSVMLLFGGTLISIRMFIEFSKKEDAVHYLTLPAGQLEKFLSKWILALPFYFLVCILIFIISYPLISFIAGQAWGYEYPPFYKFRWAYFIDAIFFYCFISSISFFISIVFSNKSSLRTVFHGLVVWVAYAIVIYNLNNEGMDPSGYVKNFLRDNLALICLLLSFIIWYLSYQRFKLKSV